MSRRDTIMIAVLINTGMLAILFMMAIHTEDDLGVDSVDISSHLVEDRSEEGTDSQVHVEPLALAQTSSQDEVDNMLKDYAAPTSTPPLAVDRVVQPPSMQQNMNAQKAPQPKEPDPAPAKPKPDYVEVTVKRGDCLGKIALANNTTVSEIKKANNMASERIDIGQVLRVPVNTKNKTVRRSSRPATSQEGEEEYYTIQRGDNPWKVAKQFHVKFDDLLILNNLNEEKARNLKVGDRIRVK